MAVEKTSQRKLVLFSYDKTNVKGRNISVQAAQGDAEPVEKKNPPNSGHGFVTFGHDFVGESHIRVVGSSGGEDEGVIHVA
jgi:hypothetical protein